MIYIDILNMLYIDILTMSGLDSHWHEWSGDPRCCVGYQVIVWCCDIFLYIYNFIHFMMLISAKEMHY